jgi:wyosine [tRNA(Phe)-imidazoG37] synthetase (radical SAM superfamily)
MKNNELRKLPYMVYADKEGRIYDHPYFRMAGFRGSSPAHLKPDDLMPLTEFSKLFFIPDCPPIGLDPSTGEYETVSEIEVDGAVTECFAVAAFLEPGLVRSHLPAVHYGLKSYTLPMWAYTAVGFTEGSYWAAGFGVEYNHKWDPKNYDDRELLPAIEKYRKEHGSGPLVEHLINCATVNHCFAAKNLFLERWEAPLPVSRACNAACLGCLSFQPEGSCEASHDRICFRPSTREIVSLSVHHLNQAPEPIMSFGQGCEGEPLTEYRLISESIREIRKKTGKGTLNLNTNGSMPERVREIADSGLDSIRISMNSARPELYRAYYRPKNYDFEDVVASLSLSKDKGLYTMINYLVFPGVTDQEEEIEALMRLIQKTRVHFIHLKNLDIDPQLYLEKMPESHSPAVGIKEMAALLNEEFPDVELGYFNRPVERNNFL